MSKWWKQLPLLGKLSELEWLLVGMVVVVVVLWLLSLTIAVLFIDWIRGYVWRS